MKSEVTFIELDETVSTNTFLATYRPAEPDTITVVTTEFQTAGRGQTGNSWESEKGKNLLFSILVQPKTLPATHVFLLSEAIALSIREVIADALHFQWSMVNGQWSTVNGQRSMVNGQRSITVKWPNDIYVDDRKIAGILIENELCGHNVGRSIIGCGVNINQQSFLFPSLTSHLSPLTPQPSARACSLDTSRIINHQSPTPVSLHQLIGRDSDRRPILNHILDAFQHRYASLTPHPSTPTISPLSIAAPASIPIATPTANSMPRSSTSSPPATSFYAT